MALRAKLGMGRPRENSHNILKNAGESYDYLISPQLSLPLFLDPLFGRNKRKKTHAEQVVDINNLVIDNPENTFFMRVSGDSMKNAGISDGNILIVDKSEEPSDGRIVVAEINSRLTVKKVRYNNGKISFHPENPEYDVISVNSDDNVMIWGVVVSIIKTV